MEDIKLIEAIEKYIEGGMTPDERVYFEQLRKTNPEIDQLVVEHTFFMQQLARFDETKAFKSKLNDVHTGLTEKGLIKSPRLKGKAKVVYLFNRYKRTAAIAASIAGITALTMSALVWSFSPGKPSAEIKALSREISALKTQNRQQNREINTIKENINVPLPAVTYKTGGTSFMIDPKGYLVTNAHIVQNARSIVVQNNEGREFAVNTVYIDVTKDLAILKIVDSTFKSPSSLPYTVKKTTAEIAEPIYTLGFPRNEIVYGEGYLAAKTGYNGDTLSCQIAIAANPGNSGGPIINRYGEIVGVLSAKQMSAEGVVFATQSKYIYQALTELQKDSSQRIKKLPAVSALRGVDRMQQVKKISDFIYMVKVS